MATDFTALPVRLASNLLLTMCLYGCIGNGAGEPADAVVPAVYRKITDTAFSRHDGFLYHRQQKFSGHLYSLFPNGDTAYSGAFVNGKETGRQRSWYNRQQLMEERWYENGHKEGIHKGWWPGGNPKFCYHFANDEYEGEVTEWDETGQIYRRMHYQQGREEGLQQMWWSDGKLRANYVVKEGKSYGLIGRKLCINDSTTKQ